MQLEKGNYKGFYKYDKAQLQQAMGSEQTFFDVEIEQVSGSEFEGTVSEEASGMPGTGTITGHLNGDHIRFVKRMPVSSAITRSGERKTIDAQHPDIHYEGVYSDGVFKGTWKIRFHIRFVKGMLMIGATTRGTWQMKKNN